MPSGAAVADLAGAEDVSGSRKGWEEMRAGWMEGGMDGVDVPWKTMVWTALSVDLMAETLEKHALAVLCCWFGHTRSSVAVV